MDILLECKYQEASLLINIYPHTVLYIFLNIQESLKNFIVNTYITYNQILQLTFYHVNFMIYLCYIHFYALNLMLEMKEIKPVSTENFSHVQRSFNPLENRNKTHPKYLEFRE